MLHRKLFVVFAAVLIGSLLAAAWWAYELQWSVDRLIISRATTFIEEPLRSDGYPDYVEALNRQISEGVTPGNNAAVLVLRAMGPDGVDEDIRAEFFDRLGISEPPATGKYFEDWDEFFKRIPDAERPQPPAGSTDTVDYLLLMMEVDAGERPWRRGEFPHIAEWLDANERQLDLIVAASKMPRYYAPMVPSGESRTLMGVLTPSISILRDASRALVCRAMRRLGEGEVDGAWEDLMVCRRLARLVGQGPMALDSLVGHAVDSPAVDGQTIVLDRFELSAATCAKIQKELDALPRFTPLADRIDLGERLHALDTILAIARKGRELEIDVANRDSELFGLSLSRVDWNIPLERMNAWLDRCIAAARLADRKQRAAALKSLKAELDNAAQAIEAPTGGIASLFSGKALSEQNSQVFIGLIGSAMITAFQAEERTQTNHDLLRIAVALAQYKVERGNYPEKLEELVPMYIEAVPADAFAGTPLVYKKRSSGYLLYGIGPNQIDEGGKSYDEKGDDLTIEVPWKGVGRTRHGGQAPDEVQRTSEEG